MMSHEDRLACAVFHFALELGWIDRASIARWADAKLASSDAVEPWFPELSLCEQRSSDELRAWLEPHVQEVSADELRAVLLLLIVPDRADVSRRAADLADALYQLSMFDRDPCDGFYSRVVWLSDEASLMEAGIVEQDADCLAREIIAIVDAFGARSLPESLQRVRLSR